MRIRTYIRSLAPLSWRDESVYVGIVGSVLWAILAVGGGFPVWVAAAAIAVWELVHLWWNRVPISS